MLNIPYKISENVVCAPRAALALRFEVKLSRVLIFTAERNAGASKAEGVAHTHT